MYRACIAIVDAARARLFVFRRSFDGSGLLDELAERPALVNLARRTHPSELFSDGRSGSNRIGDLSYGFDDHREAHLDELDAEFARSIVGELKTLLRSTEARRLIVCASPRMLGQLRSTGSDLRRNRDLAIDELPRDLTKLETSAIRERLAGYGLLAPATR